MKKNVFYLLVAFIPTIFSCAGRAGPKWIPYTFNGSDFSVTYEKNLPVVWTRKGHFPVVSIHEPDSAATDPLPKGTGAIAGICYIQSSGGKLSGQSQLIPYSDEQVSFRNVSDGSSVTRTDKSGYFLDYLPKGDYVLFCRGVNKTFSIKEGETTFVPIRGGKRMAD